MEIWKSIPGYEGLYEASSLGRIRGKCGRIKAQRIHLSAGDYIYLKTDLFKENERKTFRVHRLVLMAFKGMPDNGQVARHLDSNSINNYPENLEWGTQFENIQDREKKRKGVAKGGDVD